MRVWDCFQVVFNNERSIGKHPVCALQELCSKKQWDPPSYDIVSETGPQHMRTFVYKVNE